MQITYCNIWRYLQWSPSIPPPPESLLTVGSRWYKYITLCLSTKTTPLQRPCFTDPRGGCCWGWLLYLNAVTIIVFATVSYLFRKHWRSVQCAISPSQTEWVEHFHYFATLHIFENGRKQTWMALDTVQSCAWTWKLGLWWPNFAKGTPVNNRCTTPFPRFRFCVPQASPTTLSAFHAWFVIGDWMECLSLWTPVTKLHCIEDFHKLVLPLQNHHFTLAVRSEVYIIPATARGE